jgi:hypothetical protein
MSLQALADQMKSRGRNGDSELVHMTKGEVAGLQQLAMAAGGSLTINPDTGLPEASFLKSLLPTILGAGAMFIPGMGPLGAAMIGGAAGMLTNEDNPLMGALTGGLGGYGGASLAGGFGLGSAAATPATSAGLTAGSGAPTLKASSDLLSRAPAYSIAPATVAEPGLRAATAALPAAAPSMGGKQMLTSGLMALAPGMMHQPSRGTGLPGEKEDDEDLMNRYTYSAGYTGGTPRPGSAFTGERVYFQPEYRRAFAEGGETAADPARGMTGESRDALLYLYGQAPAMAAPAPMPAVAPQTAAPSQRYIFDPQTQTYFNNPAFADVSDDDDKRPTRLFGRMLGFGGDDTAPAYFDAQGNRLPLYDASGNKVGGNSRFDFGFAKGGIAALAQGGMKAGGFVVPADVVSMVGEGNTEAGYEQIKRMLPGATPIKGKDGGQADTVKTSIEGKQPAAVAHGEMYVPPETVKRAGGAKKLYAMMNNVRKQAKGDTKQIKPVNLKKAMA